MAGVCEHLPATGFDACQCEFDELPQQQASCGTFVAGRLSTVLTNAAELVDRAPGHTDPRAARPMVRRALQRLAQASRVLTRARRKGVAPACVDEVASRIRGARASARAWLAGY